MPEFVYKLAELDGTALWDMPGTNVTWTHALNDEGSATMQLPMRGLSDLFYADVKSGSRVIEVWKDNVRKYSGRLWDITASSNDEEFRISSRGWLFDLKRRSVSGTTEKWVATDQFDIAWELIDYTQDKVDGDLGITRGPEADSGVLRDRTFPFWEQPFIGDEIVAMSELSDGFDFEIDAERVFHMYYPNKGAVKSIPLELGKNIATFGLQEDATGMANSFSAIGAGDGSNTCIAVAIDATSRSQYGLLEANESFTDIKTFTTLQSRATSRLARIKKPRRQPNLYAVFEADQDYDDYEVGDRVQVEAEDGYISFDEQMRIITMTHQITNEGRETVTVGLDQEVTAP